MMFYIQAMAFSLTHFSHWRGGKKGYSMQSVMWPGLICHDPVHMHVNHS